MTAKTFYEWMSEHAKDLTSVNHFAAFLLHCIFNELRAQNPAAPIPQGKYVEHPLPMPREDFPYFPANINHADVVYEREQDALSDWLHEGKTPESFCLHQKERLARKTGLVVQKILSCANDFSHHVEKISQENKIPISSLMDILLAMTFDMREYSLPSHASNDKDRDSALQGYPSLDIFLPNILISADVPIGDRDRKILSAIKSLYDLFQEAFWVLMVSGMTGLINSLIFARDKNLDDIKKHLIDAACFILMEERVRDIRTYEDFYSYVVEEMGVFKQVFPTYSRLCMNYIQKAALARIRLTQTTSSISLEQHKVSLKSGAAIKAADDLHDQYIDKISYDKNSHGSGYGAATSYAPYSSDDFVAKPSTENASMDIHNANRLDAEYFRRETESFEFEILMESAQRLLYNPLRSYKLKGKPENLIKYIRAIIDNRTFDLIHENYDFIIKDMFGRSPRTLRRIEKEEFDKKLTGNSERMKRRGRTLSDVDTQHRISERENRRAHKLAGYWNKEELVAELRKPSKIREANNNGIPLKIYSRTKLLKRINNAVNKGLIKPKQVSRYYYFKYEDFLRIARAIA